MKRFNIPLLVWVFAMMAAFTHEPYQELQKAIHPAPVQSLKLDINNISTWFRNNGEFNREPITGNAGFEWPKNSGHKDRYASGFWMGAKVGTDTLICLTEYDSEFLPGYVDNSGNAAGYDDPAYRIYNIIRGDTLSADYLNWPAYQGAYLNTLGKPYFLGTQTMFYSFTDAYPQAHGNNAGSTGPMKAQILQTNWSYTNLGMRDVCFTEYRVINRSQLLWRDCFIAVWTDDDIGYETFDDAYGIDTVRDMGYCYNFNNTDPAYGINPPACGFKVLKGPVVPSPGDTAVYYNPPGSQNKVTKPGHRIMKTSVYNIFWNSDPVTGDPSNFRETYLVLGGKRRNGTPWINPQTGDTAKLVFPGDPVTNTGWVPRGGPQRSLLIFGPLDMQYNDTQSVIIAQLEARGSSHLNSITRLRELSDYVQKIYDNNFQSVLHAGSYDIQKANEFELHQNYPNPFNPSTTISYELPVRGFVKVKVYDVTGRQIADIVNEEQAAGRHELIFNGDGYASGVYFYVLEVDGFTKAVKSMCLIR